jgi:hypothetical protein
MLGIDIVPARLSDLPLVKNLFLGKRAGYDGIIITVLFGRLRTRDYTGLEIDRALENIHSTGFFAGSCLISNTYLHLTLIRHGSVFQLIDPWETSWYAGFGMEMVTRGLALGNSVGQAFTEGMLQVGVGYLTKQWWWDLKENICYFGDPDIHVYTPKYSWEEPETMDENEVVGGHALYGATGHPHGEDGGDFGVYIIVLIAIVAVAGVVYFKRKM